MMTYRRRPSPLHAARASVACAYVLALSTVAVVSEHPLVLGALLVAVLGAGALAGVGRELARGARFAVPFAIVVAVINPLVQRDGLTVIARLGELPPFGQLDITLEATAYGGVLGLRALVILLCFGLYSTAVDPDEVLRLFRRVSYRSALTATLATRMVPVLARDGRRLAEAQRCRPDGGASRAGLVRAVASGALDRAVDVAATLEVRGYGGAHRPPRSRRPWSRHDFAFATAAVAFAVGAALGPVMGGVLLDSFWWGSVFLVNVPVMLVLLAAGPRLLPEYRAPDAGRVDLPSVALSLAGMLGIVYGIKRGAQDGVDALAIGALVAGLVAGVAFLRRQPRLRDPLVDLALFRSPRFSAALGIAVLAAFVMYGAYLLSTGFMQLVLDLSALEAGLWLVPSAIAVAAGSNVAPVLARRFPPAMVVAGGLVVMAAGFGALVGIEADSPLALLVAASVVIHFGVGPVATLLTGMIIGAAPPERAGAASALSHTGNELGGALGLGLLGTLATAVYRDEAGGTGSAFAGARGVAEDAFAHAFAITALASAALVAAGIALALVVLRGPEPEAATAPA